MTADAPPLPPGRQLELPGRGTTFVRETGPTGGPAVLLLHGLTASNDVNWFGAYGPLADAGFRVVAVDHRGHGRGLRSAAPFTLVDCADDAAAALRVLGVERAVVAGYSMGGPISLLLWRRHPGLVGGLVLCATVAAFGSGRANRLVLGTGAALAAAGRLAPWAFDAVAGRAMARRNQRRNIGGWIASELERGSWPAILEGLGELARFDGRPWLADVGVPAAVVVTDRDVLVPPAAQLAMAARIPDATVHHVDGDHVVCVTDPARFAAALVAACDSVRSRVG